MGIFDRFFQRKAFNPNIPSNKPVSGVLTPLPINYRQSTAYQSISAVYTVVTYLMQKFSQVPIRVYKVDDAEALKQYKAIQQHQFTTPAMFLKSRKLQRKALNQVDENNDLSKLLQQPNKNQSSDEFFSVLYGFKLLKGEGFIWANREQEGDEKSPILEMYATPPQIMHLVPDRNDVYGIDSWVIQLPQQRVLAKEDVLLWKYPRFDFDSTTHIHLRGQSPLAAATSDLEGVSAVNEAYKSIFTNKGANGLIATQDPNMTPGEMSDMLAKINERMNGYTNAGNIAGLNAISPSFFDLSMSTREMMLIEAKKFAVTQVAQLYNAPAGIWDLSEAANNNITQYRAQVYTDKIMGEWASLLNQLNTWLLPAFGMRGYYIDADYSEIPDLQADFQRMFDSIKEAWEITPNEKRELRGYELSADPLMDTQWVPSGFKPIADASIDLSDIDDMGEPTGNNSEDRA